MARRLEANLERMAELVNRAAEELRGLADSAKSTDDAFEGVSRSAGRAGGEGGGLLGAIGGGLRGPLFAAAGATVGATANFARQAFVRQNRYGEDFQTAFADTARQAFADLTGIGAGERQAVSNAAQRTFALFEDAARFGQPDQRVVRRVFDRFQEQEERVDQFRQSIQREETRRKIEGDEGSGLLGEMRRIRELLEGVINGGGTGAAQGFLNWLGR